MKVYLRTGRRNHTVHCTPGNESDTSDFFNPDRSIRQFAVQFIDGVAEVPGPLGKYLIDKGIAQKTALIEADHAAAVIIHEERWRKHRVLDGNYHG